MTDCFSYRTAIAQKTKRFNRVSPVVLQEALPPKNSVRIAVLALTLVQVLYNSHAFSNTAHLHLSAEVTSLNWPIETMIIESDDINGRVKGQPLFLITSGQCRT